MGIIDDIDESTLGEEFEKPIPNAQLIYRNNNSNNGNNQIPNNRNNNTEGDEIPFYSNGDENHSNGIYPIIPQQPNSPLPPMYFPQQNQPPQQQQPQQNPQLPYQIVSPYQNVNIIYQQPTTILKPMPLVPVEVEFYPLWTPVLISNMNSYCVDSVQSKADYSQCFNNTLTYIYAKPNVAQIDDDLLLQVQQCKGLQYLNLSNCNFKLELFNKTIQGLKILKAINLNNCIQITDQSIITLAKNTPQLEEVHLNGCQQLTDESISFLVEKCPKIKILSLSNCIKLTDRSILQICRYLKDLQSLCINKIKSFTEKSLGELKKFQGMKSFFAFNTLITDTVLSELSIKWRSIEVLNIGKCLNISDISLSTVAFHSHSLQKLFLQGNRNITKLSIILVSQNCPDLRVLRVDDCYNLTDEAILTLESCKKLEILNISGLLKISELSILKILPLLTELKEVYLYRSPRITNATVDMISNNLPSLRALRIDNSYFPNDESVISLSKSCVSLTTLNLSSLLITNASLISISTHMTHLKKLYLSECKHIGDEGLFSVTQNLINLEVLRLDGSINFSEAALNSLSKLVTLDTLNLSGQQNVTSSVIGAITLSCRDITHLHLSKCVQLDDKVLPYIFVNLYKLKTLRIDGCLSITHHSIGAIQFPQRLTLEIFNCSETSIGDIGLYNILNQSSVKELYAWDLQFLTDEGLRLISTISPSLQIRVLRLDKNKNITGSGLKNLISKLPLLHTVNISNVPKSSDEVINALAANCKSLEKLFCQHNTSGDRAFTRVTESCPQLKVIDVSRCKNVTDGLVIELSFNSKRLKKIILSHNDSITNASIIKLSVGCPLLKFVNLDYCKNVGEIGVLALSTYCKQIQVLKVTNCPLVTDLSIVGIARECLNLKTLYAGGTGISNSAIIEISVRQNINFETLDLNNAKKISNDAFIVLANNCISLKYLNLHGTGVTQQAIKLFTDNCRLLNNFQK